MATANHNLSEYSKVEMPSAKGLRIGIVVARWNEKITNGLLQGAFDCLIENKINKQDIFIEFVPGSFELPLGAQWVLAHQKVDAVICLGSVIQGETKHFDYVCETTAMGIKDVALKFDKPVIFGVLTDNNEQQAIDRSGGKHGNKGTEAAATAIKMVALRNKLA